ncbi:RagB/SusD family nutrient uptake outer membrane protein [Mucilaginibacter rubeus]|uniref:RagB/SusD family nutrient uptake outer membrane protein n=1 Tax=Mucilaginibacter rubeus TaxID=2027860 RepID=UPI00166CF952|nr:RagB/SusD family nutrient uptake outer membrane protein [Mucilaginibacter rubeus]GGA96875.1 membrane protein [Mucilaginibacter rubeus]
MKRISIYLYTCLFLGLATTACKKTLIEDPKSTLTPAFFTTSQGFQAGLTAAYAGFRTIWGPDTYFELTVPGTDEFIAGNDGNNGLVKYNSNFNTADGTVATIWKNCYTYINTCNGLIGNVPADIDATTAASMVGEAKFLRANYYFILVQFWGDVTLNKTFQSVPTTSANRDKMADVYNFIVQDLKDAIAVLPASPLTNGVQPGRATKAAAMHMLAKVYLTRAGSSAKQADDYKNAYATAIDLITNVAPAGGIKLQQDFGKVFAEGNETNSEILWTVQHTTTLAYNGSATQNNSGPDNLLCHLFVPKYEVQPGMQRSTLYGRPYIRVVPTHWLTDTVFSERVNDQRYNKTFQTMWLCNNAASIPTWSNPLPAGAPVGAQPGAPKFTVGDTAIWMPGKAMTSAQIAGYRYQVIPPAKYSIALSPAMIKYFDTKRPDQNSPSSRPIIIYRLAETYLIAAEALFMDGRAGDAVPYINAIRERAAYPSGNAAAMDITVDKLSLDFILDERSRELCGELVRWLDLARTGKLLERVKLHNTDGKANIKPFHVLRPIPQTQIDATITGTPYPQNPGW